ncbi:hypothetical protein EDD86DRAFT_210232 [Gorgonomyces haynaldii]|nr:hypothetical protein EDD86DRAFT_210232 [Gorgonomyces haynaldii]
MQQFDEMLMANMSANRINRIADHVLENPVLMSAFLDSMIQRLEKSPKEYRLQLYYVIDCIVKKEHSMQSDTFLSMIKPRWRDVFMFTSKIREQVGRVLMSWMQKGIVNTLEYHAAMDAMGGREGRSQHQETLHKMEAERELQKLGREEVWKSDGEQFGICWDESEGVSDEDYRMFKIFKQRFSLVRK